MQKPIVDELKDEYAGQVDIQYLDVYDNMEEAQKLGVTAVPTLVFYDAGGGVAHQNAGLMQADELRSKLDELKTA